MQEGDPVAPQTSSTVDKGDAGYDKALKNRHLQMIAIGGSIGTGLFLGTGGRLAQGGPGLAISYAVCGIFAFLMVRALGEMAIRRPSSGAFVSYAREFMGEKGAYVTGWFFFLDWSVTVMADITAVALYLHYWTALRVVPQWVLALIALGVVFTLNMLSVKMFGEAEFWFAAIKVTAIILFMIAAIWAIVTGARVDNYTAGFHNIAQHGGFFPTGLAPLFALTLGAINSMILRIFVFYVGSIILMALVLPYTAYSTNESPFVTFFTGIGIPYAGDIIQVIVLTAALSSLNAGLYSTGRTLRSLAVAGEAPKAAAKLNRHHVPSGGIAMTAALGLLGVALNAFLPDSAFEIVMNLAGIGIAGTWAMVLLSHTRFVSAAKSGKESRPEYRMPGAPVTNYISLAFLLVVVLSNLTSESGRWTLALFALVAIAMVAGWYAVRNSIKPDLLDNVVPSEEGM